MTQIADTQQLIDAATRAQAVFESKQSILGEEYRKAVKHLHRYGRAIDVFIQQDPFVTSLVWGSLRVIIEES